MRHNCSDLTLYSFSDELFGNECPVGQNMKHLEPCHHPEMAGQPKHNLPTDVLSNIFPIAAHNSVYTALRLSHVNQHWRETALSISALWSNFDSILNPDVTAMQMSRVSPQAPISIRLRMWEGWEYHLRGQEEQIAERLLSWIKRSKVLEHEGPWSTLWIEMPPMASMYFQAVDNLLVTRRHTALGTLRVSAPIERYDTLYMSTLQFTQHFRPRHIHSVGTPFVMDASHPICESLESLDYRMDSYNGQKLIFTSFIPCNTQSYQHLHTLALHSIPFQKVAKLFTVPAIRILHLHSTFSTRQARVHDAMWLSKIQEFAPNVEHLMVVDVFTVSDHEDLEMASPETIFLSRLKTLDLIEISRDYDGYAVPGLLNIDGFHPMRPSLSGKYT